MKYVPATSNLDRQLFKLSLLPSWLSATTAVAIGLLVGVGTVLFSHFQSSSFRVEILDTPLSSPTRYQTVTQHILSNSFISNLPLLIFWILTGLVVYLFVANVFGAIRNTAALKSEMDYVNVDRHELLMNSTQHLLMRLVVLIGWIIYIVFFFNHIAPYCVAVALTGANQLSSIQGILYVLLSIVLMTLAIHLHTIFLRLFLLRPRVFTTALYID